MSGGVTFSGGEPFSQAETFTELAKLLNDGLIYNDILEKTGASSATISRVNRSLNYGMGAYRIIFDRMKEEEQKQKEQQA